MFNAFAFQDKFFLQFHFIFHKNIYFVPVLKSPTSYRRDAFTNILNCRLVARLSFDVFCSVIKRDRQPTDELSTVKRWDIVVTRATHWGHTWFEMAPKICCQYFVNIFSKLSIFCFEPISSNELHLMIFCYAIFLKSKVPCVSKVAHRC